MIQGARGCPSSDYAHADMIAITSHNITLSFFISNILDLAVAGNMPTYLMLLCILLLFCSNIFIFVYMKKRYSLPPDIKKIGSPCFDAYPNQYSSLPTKEDRPKVKRQTSFNGVSSMNSKLLQNSHGTLSKSNNVNSHHTPKVLSKCFVELDSTPMRRNSNGPNNLRQMRTVEDDKF